MESIVGIQRAPSHPTQLQALVAVQAVGVTRAQAGIELSLIGVEYYPNAFAILWRLRVADMPDTRTVRPPLIIPILHARVVDATGARYAAEYEPFLGSSADYRGILRVTPRVPISAVPCSVVIDSVILYGEDGQRWQELRFDPTALVYTVGSGQTAL
jgi:hypothetical protein